MIKLPELLEKAGINRMISKKGIVAVEKACLDLVNEAPPLPWSVADKYRLKSGDNKFLRIHGRDPIPTDRSR